MNIFVETDYRYVISELVREFKAQGKRITLGKLAADANMQKAHMTNVLKRRASFQSDQMYLICKSLGLEDDKCAYMMLLLEYERTGLAERRRDIKKELDKLQSRHLQTETHLSGEKTAGKDLGKIFPEYYLEPLHQLVHIAISIERFAKNVNALAESLGIPIIKVQQILNKLVEKGLVEKTIDRYQNIRRNSHLKKTSPVFRAWRHQLNSMANARLQQGSGDDHYGFTAVFSADEGTRKKMQAKILELIKSLETEVKHAPPQGVYQFSIDLLPWML